MTTLASVTFNGDTLEILEGVNVARVYRPEELVPSFLKALLNKLTGKQPKQNVGEYVIDFAKPAPNADYIVLGRLV